MKVHEVGTACGDCLHVANRKARAVPKAEARISMASDAPIVQTAQRLLASFQGKLDENMPGEEAFITSVITAFCVGTEYQQAHQEHEEQST